MRADQTDGPHLSDQVKSDLRRVGLLLPNTHSQSSDVEQAHGDLGLFLPLLARYDVRLVPFARKGCPIRFCTAILKQQRGESRAELSLPKPISAGGQGNTLVVAALGCLGELAERLSLCSLGQDDPRGKAREDMLPEVEIAKVFGLSETPLGNSEAHVRPVGGKSGKGEASWREMPESQVDLTLLGGGGKAQFPSAGVLFGDLGGIANKKAGFASTVGCAVWSNREGARSRALLELVERDAVAQAWYNRLGITRLNQDQIRSILPDLLVDFLEQESRQWTLCKVDTDLCAHAMIAVSSEADGKNAAFGSAAGWTMTEAANAALREMLQSENALQLMARAYPEHDGKPSKRLTPPRQLVYARQKSIFDDLPIAWNDPVGDEQLDSNRFTYEDLVQSCLEQGLEIWEFDATRPDLNIPCIKLLSKDLCSWEPRFGKRRLFEGVVERGLRAQPATVAEFARRPFPF